MGMSAKSVLSDIEKERGRLDHGRPLLEPSHPALFRTLDISDFNHHGGNGLENNLQVQPQRSRSYVLNVKIDHFVEGRSVLAGNLRSGQAACRTVLFAKVDTCCIRWVGMGEAQQNSFPPEAR
jgi:hypothetical protein